MSPELHSSPPIAGSEPSCSQAPRASPRRHGRASGRESSLRALCGPVSHAAGAMEHVRAAGAELRDRHRAWRSQSQQTV